MSRRPLRDTLVITRRNLRRYIRLPQLLFFSSVQPVMFLLLFTYVFGGALGGAITVPGGTYIDYLLPGILVQMVMFGGVQTGIGLADDLGKGIIDRFRSLPMSRLAVVAGRTVSDTIRNAAVITIMIAVGLLIGFRFHATALAATASLLVALAFGFALSWVFALVGLWTKEAESAQLASFAVVFPLTFASSAFVPVQTMPDWLQAFAGHQPVTAAVDAVRQLALGMPGDGSVTQSLAWSAVLLAAFVPLALWQYKRRVS